MAAALAAERVGVDDLVAAFNERRKLPQSPETVKDLVTRFKAAPDGFLKLREGTTRKNWSPWLDAIVDEFGGLPVAALPHKGVKRDIIEWRNRWANQPRSADYAIQVIRRLFSWAMENELADANPAEGIKGLYSANRADIIVEPAELEVVLAHTTPAGRALIRLAALTGMRRGDLLDLQWSEIGDGYIEREANKSTTGRRILVPLIPEARDLVAELRAANKARKIPSTFVLTSAKGQWSTGGVDKTWNRAAKEKAGVDKHFNDLRGTACTNFYLKVANLSDEEAADIMGWEPARCRAIRKRYVDPARIAAGIVKRMEKKGE
jgi:integrase